MNFASPDTPLRHTAISRKVQALARGLLKGINSSGRRSAWLRVEVSGEEMPLETRSAHR
jgi:hypothetical protein